MENQWEEFSDHKLNNNMGCPPTPLSCLDPVNIFAGVYNPRCGGFGDPSNFKAEQAIYKSSFEELINNYGVEINYYVNGFNLSAMNTLYGEHPTQEYSEPFVIKCYLELEEAISLSQFGMNSDDELKAYISINDFTTKIMTNIVSENDLIIYDNYGNLLIDESEILDFLTANGQRVEPKSDDLIEVTALGCDRPGNRGSKIFRITEVLDQSIKDGINPVMGHYVWQIYAKRYETSFETNAPMERGNDQVYDNAFAGKVESTLFPTLSTDKKVYDFDVDVDSKNRVYDMDNTDNNIYGDYYGEVPESISDDNEILTNEDGSTFISEDSEIFILE